MISIDVNKQVEMMNIILYTSRYNEKCREIIGFEPMIKAKNEYVKEIDLYFNRFSEHKIYSKLEKMVSKGFFLSRPIELVLSLNPNDFLESRYEISEFSLALSGGKDEVEEFQELLNDFSKVTEFDKFFERVRYYYKDSITFMNECLNKYSFIEELNKFYGTNNMNYSFIISNLCIGNFGIHFKCEDKTHVYSIYTCYNKDINSEQSSFDKEQFCNTVFHELSHPVINPLTEKYIDLVNEYSHVHEELKQYKNEHYSGYGDWEECVNEHIIRAIAIYMIKKHGKDDYVKYDIKHQYELGYRYIENIIKRLEYYENNRQIYSNIEAFYPKLIEVFSESN